MTLEQSLEFTGWQVSDPHHRLRTALDYFQNTVDLDYLRKPIEDPKGPDGLSMGPNPWILPRDNPIQLCLLMQAIDFSYPISVVHITKGQILKAFQTTTSFGNYGDYYTPASSRMDRLAIPRDQQTARFYESITSFRCLASTASDAYVDWAMWRGVQEEYRHGGGRQFYIWEPQIKLRLVYDCKGHLLLTSCHCLQFCDRRQCRPETGILSNSYSHRFLLSQ
jgi:hypothetical protein